MISTYLFSSLSGERNWEKTGYCRTKQSMHCKNVLPIWYWHRQHKWIWRLMKFQLQVVSVTQICLSISFAFKVIFFLVAAIQGCCSGGVQESAGEAPVCRDVISTKLQISFKWDHALAWVSSCGLAVHFRGAVWRGASVCFFFVYLLFFCFGINPTGEIGIQLDVSLWSQER